MWSIDRLTQARFSAQRQRAEALLLIADETFDDATIWEALRAAATPDGRALMRLSLRQLLAAQPGWSIRRADETIKKTLIVSGSSTKSRTTGDIDVSWLLDPRVGGKRFAALCDAMHGDPSSRNTIPWPGFPYSPAPFDAAWAQEQS